jgi:hypothetical protein
MSETPNRLAAGRKFAAAISERFYAALLRLLPAEFREQYGGEMAQLFRDRCRREGVLRVVLEALPDLTWTAWREHFETAWRDIRYSLRSLRQAPAFAAARHDQSDHHGSRERFQHFIPRFQFLSPQAAAGNDWAPRWTRPSQYYEPLHAQRTHRSVALRRSCARTQGDPKRS